MNLFNINTLWVFISGNDEDRFIGDIRFGLGVLKSKGVEAKNIKIFIDGEKNLIHARFGKELISCKVLPISSLEEELYKKDYENVVLFTTGHGNEFGLAGSNFISPYKLLEIIRAIPSLKRGLFVIGQCYAGIFNHIEAKPKDTNLAELCILGSTGFSPSLSSSAYIEEQIPVKLKDLYNLEKWLANVFLFYFFLWLYEPKDIDGNGELTVMDAFKFASIKTNEHLNKMKTERSYDFPSIVKDYSNFFNSLSKIYPDLESHPDDLHQLFRDHLQFQVASEKEKIDEFISILYMNQEPFICNSWFAQELKFETLIK